MAEAAVLYGLAGTDACRKACAWLDRFGHAYRFVDTQRERPAPEALKAWAQAAGGWDALADRGGKAWKNLLPQRRNPESDPEWTLLIREHPGVLRQPLAVLADGRVVAGFTGGSYEKRFGKTARTGA
ncbi:MAG: ArsC/Spx/MgsR family protein [Dyella sp.]|uniref:ArsC/Spx/MgsR family protein n=1 Tax=Dyella sp. TaxID=1869338 RepID=UPI003F81EAC6